MAPILRVQGSKIRGHGKIVYVRGKWISFSREQIDQKYNLHERKNGSKFKKLVKELDFQKIIDLLTDGKGKWNATRKTHTSPSPKEH